MDRNSTRLLVAPALAGITFILTGALFTGSAQTLPPDSQAAETQQTQTFTADQLTDLVAPIALYPDGLLSQVLVASTYPLEVVEAQQWLQQNPTLRGTQLTDAAKQQPWDPSVQALVAFPDVLNRLNQDVTLDQGLGQRISGAGGRRDGSGPAAARVGAGQRTSDFHVAANGQHGNARWPTGYRHSAGQPRCNLRASL